MDDYVSKLNNEYAGQDIFYYSLSESAPFSCQCASQKTRFSQETDCIYRSKKEAKQAAAQKMWFALQARKIDNADDLASFAAHRGRNSNAINHSFETQTPSAASDCTTRPAAAGASINMTLCQVNSDSVKFRLNGGGMVTVAGPFAHQILHLSRQQNKMDFSLTVSL